MITMFAQHLDEKGIKRSALAKLLNVSKGTATKWCQGRVPAERVLEVEKITGIDRHDIRPDIYPREVA